MRRYNSNDDSSQPRPSRLKQIAKYGTVTAACAGIGILSFAAYRYRVAPPSKYVVRTGFMIDKVAVGKKAFQWPFQTFKMISVEPK